MEAKLIYEGFLSRTILLAPTLAVRIGNLPVRDQCNTGIVVTTDGLILVDYPKQQPDEEIIEEAEKLFHQRVSHIFLTHAHGDHRNGLSTLHRKDIILVASPACAEEIQTCFPELSNPVHVIHPKEILAISRARFSFRVPSRLPAHSPWDMIIEYQNERTIFAGDFLNPPGPLYFRSSCCQNWIDELEILFRETDPSYRVIMGHGDPCLLGEASDTLAYLKGLAKLAPELIKMGIPSEEEDATHFLSRCDKSFRQAVENLSTASSIGHVIGQLREICQCKRDLLE